MADKMVIVYLVSESCRTPPATKIDQIEPTVSNRRRMPNCSLVVTTLLGWREATSEGTCIANAYIQS